MPGIEWNKNNEWVLNELFGKMPIEKCNSLSRTMYRNFCFTSDDVPEHCRLAIYKEGWYFEAEGCQCRFAVWAKDNDGEMVFGRKPAEKFLHFLWSDTGSQYRVPWKLALDRATI